MEKRLLPLMLFSFLFVLNSCLSTLYPFFTERDVIFNPILIGKWTCNINGEKHNLTFEAIPEKRLHELAPGIRKLAGRGYLLTWKDSLHKTYSSDFVFLAKIGNNFYLDLYPAEMDFEKLLPDAFKEYYIKMHSCYRIDLQNPNQFKMKRLEASFLDDLIRKKQIRIRYEETGPPEYKRFITAPTKDLQNYLVKYGDHPDAYNGSLSFTCHRFINY
jgi:hypothetical protein